MPSRREQTRHVNETRLVKASREVFASTEYGAVTIRDIVRRSGLSRGTFYNYLGSKEAAFEAVAASLVSEIRAAVYEARSTADSPRAFVVEPFQAMVRVLASDAETLALVSRNGRALREVVGGLGPTEGLEAELRRDLEQAIAAGLLPPLRADWLAAAMMGATLEVVTRIEPKEADICEAGTFLGELFWRTVRASEEDGQSLGGTGTRTPSSATTTSENTAEASSPNTSFRG